MQSQKFISPQKDMLAYIFMHMDHALQWRKSYLSNCNSYALDEHLNCNNTDSHIHCAIIQAINHELILRGYPQDFGLGVTGLDNDGLGAVTSMIASYEKKYFFKENPAEVQMKAVKLAASKINFDFQYDEPEDGGMSHKIQNSFVILKPDAIERSLAGELMDMIDQKGMKLIYAKLFTMTYEQISNHYNHHEGKSFWEDLVEFLRSGPSMALVYKGERACDAIRQLIGQKHPADSPAGSIRGKYAMSFPQNLIHGADSPGDAEREMKIFFTPLELIEIEINGKL